MAFYFLNHSISDAPFILHLLQIIGFEFHHQSLRISVILKKNQNASMVSIVPSFMLQIHHQHLSLQIIIYELFLKKNHFSEKLQNKSFSDLPKPVVIEHFFNCFYCRLRALERTSMLLYNRILSVPAYWHWSTTST